MTSIERGTFEECHNLTTVQIPTGVTSIGPWAFHRCQSLTEVQIPPGVTRIGRAAFKECKSLREVQIPPGLTSIEEYTFEGCDNLTTVQIPPGVTSIGEAAFKECKSLREVQIPPGLTSIEEYTFEGCDNLTTVQIPPGVTSIGEAAFKSCHNPCLLFTENPLLLNASNEHQSSWGIETGKNGITTPQNFFNTLKVYDNFKLSNRQKNFLFINKHRWQDLSSNELNAYFKDVSLDLLKQLDHPAWKEAQNIQDKASEILGNFEAIKSNENWALAQSLAQSSSFSTIGSLGLWTKLAHLTKPSNAISKRTIQ